MVIAHGLMNLFRRVHYERAVLHDWFGQRTAGYQQNAAILQRLQNYAISGIGQYGHVAIRDSGGFDADIASVYIDKSIVSWQ
jgi:hypothetical protein